MSSIPQISGNISDYRFYVTVTSVTYEVFPLNFLNTTLVDEQEKENIFYRRKFNGSLTFGTNSLVIDDSGAETNRKYDFDFFYDIDVLDPCKRVDLTINKDGVLVWEGYFSTSKGKWDLDNCTFEVTPMVSDDYSTILDMADIQYNILVGTVVSTHALRGTINQVYNRNRWLMDTIEYLALQVAPGAVVSSTFFTAVTNPVTLGANKLLYLTIAAKSDIKYPNGTAAYNAYLSWDELMKILWGMFQVRWNYVGGVLNVEHISWFTHSAGINLTTDLAAARANKYSYDMSQMPKYEYWHFMEAEDYNFIGAPIWYNSECVNQDPDSNTVETSVNVTTDLEYIYNSVNNLEADRISQDGFVILCNTYSSGVYHVEIGAGIWWSSTLLNMRLSWSRLHDAYFRHERVILDGIMNGSVKTFWSAKKTKIQEISAVICWPGDYSPDEYITTELGETYFAGAKGYVQRAVLKPYGEVNFTLAYGPAENTPTAITDPSYETDFIEGDVSSMWFDATDATPADYMATKINMSSGAEPFTVDMTDAAWAEYTVYDEDNITEITGFPASWVSGCYVRIFPINANGGPELSGIVHIDGTAVTAFDVSLTQLGVAATVTVYAGNAGVMTISDESGFVGVGGIHVAFRPHYVPETDVHYDVCWYVKVNDDPPPDDEYSSLTTGLACTQDQYKNSTNIPTPGLTWASGDQIDVYLYYESAPPPA